MLFASFVVAGVIESFYPEYSDKARAIELAHALIISVITFAWCGMHAQEHGHESAGGYRFFVAFFPPLGVPAYFLKFFGFKKGLLKTVLAVGFFLLAATAYLLIYSYLSEWLQRAV